MIFFLASLALVLLFGLMFKNGRKNLGKYLREKEKNIEKYNYRILFRIFLVFAAIPLSLLAFFVVFIEIYNLSFPENDMQLILFLLAQTAFSFSLGMYFTSIIVEQFVLSKIKKMPEYKPLRIAIKFFHGPVSHVGAYMGIVLSMFSLTFFEEFQLNDISLYSAEIFVIGVLLGLIFGIEQRINLSWRYQRVAFMVYALLLISLLFFQRIELYQEFTLLNIGCLISALSFFLYKSIKSIVRKEKNLYSEEQWWV